MIPIGRTRPSRLYRRIGARPAVGADGGDSVGGDGVIGGPEHFYFGAVDGGGDVFPKDFEMVCAACIVCCLILGVSGDIPIHLVRETQSNYARSGGKDSVHGVSDFGGVDLVEGDPGLNKYCIYCACGGRFGGGCLIMSVIARGAYFCTGPGISTTLTEKG